MRRWIKLLVLVTTILIAVAPGAKTSAAENDQTKKR
jgi:hypothetical protein